MDFLSQQLNLRIIQARQSVLDRNWKSKNGYDHFSRIYYVTGGNAKIGCGKHEILLEAGFLYLIPSCRHITHSCRKQVAISWIHIELTISSGIELFSFVDSGIIRLKCHELSLVDAFQQLTVDFPYETMSDMVRGQGLVMQLLALFFAQEQLVIPSVTLIDITRFNAVTQMIISDLGRAWRIEELAAKSGLGRVRFSTEFKRIFGIPPGKFVIFKRIERARHLLLYTDLTLDAIGSDLGFYDGFHFSKTFKRVTGISPKQLRSTDSVVIP